MNKLALVLLVVAWHCYLVQGESCDNNVCVAGGTCAIGLDNNLYCVCPQGRGGLYCEKKIHDCSSDPCQNGGQCCEDHDSYTCKCKPGFTGDHCETDIDECESNPCKNGATCVDKVNGYDCNCPQGLTGRHCGQKKPGCHRNTCLNGGTCAEADDGTWYCVCPKKFKGLRCQQSVHDCSSHPCQNGGSCCDIGDFYECHCRPGYFGTYCEKKIQPTTSASEFTTVYPSTSIIIYDHICDIDNPCHNGGTCVKTPFFGYRCHCAAGYNGKHCKKMQSTSISYPITTSIPTTSSIIYDHICDIADPCKPGGRCVKLSIWGRYKCDCFPGLSGKHCDQVQSTEIPTSSIEPSPSYPPMPSSSVNCGAGIEVNGNCVCPAGFTGPRCESYTDFCLSNPCQNDGHCVEVVGGYRCNCVNGAWGKHCEHGVQSTSIPYPITTSIPTTSSTGSSSIMLYSSSSSSSVKIWHDHICDFSWANPCKNGGKCIKEQSMLGYRCQCTAGFTGNHCNIKILSTSSQDQETSSIQHSTTIHSLPSSSSVTIMHGHRVRRETQTNGFVKDCGRKIAKAKRVFGANTVWTSIHPAIRDVLIDLVSQGDYGKALARTHAQIRRAVVTNNLAKFRRIMSDRKKWKTVPKERFLKRLKHLDEAERNPATFIVKRSKIVSCD